MPRYHRFLNSTLHISHKYSMNVLHMCHQTNEPQHYIIDNAYGKPIMGKITKTHFPPPPYQKHCFGKHRLAKPVFLQQKQCFWWQKQFILPIKPVLFAFLPIRLAINAPGMFSAGDIHMRLYYVLGYLAC